MTNYHSALPRDSVRSRVFSALKVSSRNDCRSSPKPLSTTAISSPSRSPKWYCTTPHVPSRCPRRRPDPSSNRRVGKVRHHRRTNLTSQVLSLLLYTDGRQARAKGVVLQRNRCAEYGHDSIACELADSAAVPLHQYRCAIHQLSHHSRIRSAPTDAAICIECTTSANRAVTCLYSPWTGSDWSGEPQRSQIPGTRSWLGPAGRTPVPVIRHLPGQPCDRRSPQHGRTSTIRTSPKGPSRRDMKLVSSVCAIPAVSEGVGRRWPRTPPACRSRRRGRRIVRRTGPEARRRPRNTRRPATCGRSAK